METKKMTYSIAEASTRPNGEIWYVPTEDNSQYGELSLTGLPRDFTEVYAMAEEELTDSLSEGYPLIEVPMLGVFDMSEVFNDMASDTDKRIAVGEIISHNWNDATYLEAVEETAEFTEWVELLPTSEDYAPDYAETLTVQFSERGTYEVELSPGKVRYRPYRAEYGRRSWSTLEEADGLTLDELLDTIEYEIIKE